MIKIVEEENLNCINDKEIDKIFKNGILISLIEAYLLYVK